MLSFCMKKNVVLVNFERNEMAENILNSFFFQHSKGKILPQNSLFPPNYAENMTSCSFY